ncbi:MAG: UDP-2,3-diacylglucosamine pyrophosphatase LpxH [Candidatus Azotimanducaceae bacterium]|jgi:UDP-2,3-diacylglucosamine pyrophosphatase LpxH
MTAVAHYRSIFISDVHLGTSDCQTELLLEFLQHNHCDYLYLVGDIFDLLKLKKSVFWPKIKNEILENVFEKASLGTRVIYVPGNHDEQMRNYVGNTINGIEIHYEFEHVTADNRKLLVLHGDCFDEMIRNMDWLEALGDNLYSLVMLLNRLYNRSRNWLGYPYWSLAAFIKLQFKEAVRYIEKYEETVTREAERRGFDGIVCGHIHRPNLIRGKGVTYFNTGDWVEHCSALVEEASGEIRLLYWLEEREASVTPQKVVVNF